MRMRTNLAFSSGIPDPVYVQIGYSMSETTLV